MLSNVGLFIVVFGIAQPIASTSGFVRTTTDSKNTGGKVGNFVQGTIGGNFRTNGAAPGGLSVLSNVAPLGLTYMQTLSFMFDSGKTQEIFRSASTSNRLVGVFSDPPLGGYLLPDGTKQFTNDSQPWYSGIFPNGNPAGLPSCS